MLCIHFILSIQMEHDRKEVGLLKALGVDRRDIRHIYFAKYLLFSGCGALLGFTAAHIALGPLARQLRELYGEADHSPAMAAIAIGAALLTEGIILLFIRHSLRKTDRVSALNALFQCQKKGRGRTQYVLIGAVTAACTFLMLVLENLYNTLSDPSFVTYMGIGGGELRIDVRQTDEIDNVIDEIAAALEQDRQVEKYTVLQTGSCPAVLPDGSKVNLTVEAGDHLVFPVRYSAGTAPKEEGEIALSALDAKELDLHLGDTLRLAVGGVNTDYFVCGIYSDITNGGRTAKITGSRMQTPVIWSVLYISLSESADEKAWMEQYRLPGVEVVRIADYVEDTYAQTLSRLRLASGAVMGIGVLVIVVVLCLFSRLMVERNRDTISLRKALGFTSGACECDYFAGGMAPDAAGAAVGLLLGCQGGETLCGAVPDATGSCICWTAVSGEN